MPRGVYSKVKCSKYVKPERKVPRAPRGHQKVVMDYAIRHNPHKGVLLFHELGSGKTCTAIFIADEMLRLKMVKHVFILSPGSLRLNWIQEYCLKCGVSPEVMEQHYTFITYNFDIAAQLASPLINFNDSLVIIDESHNVVKGAQNESEVRYNLIKKINASNAKVVALSGTPFYNHTYEWSILGNMLKPNVFNSVFRNQKIDMQAWAAEESRITDQMLRGIVSYFPGNMADYPQVTRESPIIVDFANAKHRNMYLEALSNEERTKLFGPPDPDMIWEDEEKYERLHKNYVLSIQWMKSRRLANYFPDGLNLDKNERYLPDLPVEKNGWMTPKLLSDPGLDVIAPKMAALIRNLIKPENLRRKHVIFSRFKENGGIYFLKTLFDWCKIPNLTYSGDESERQRAKVLDEFNAPENRYGRNYLVLFLTEAGVEGITLLDVGHMHLLESQPIGGRMEQAIGRVARTDSHKNLPPQDRTVSVWRYFSAPKNDLNLSIDARLFENAEENKKKLKQFHQRLINNSIEQTNDYDEENGYLPPIEPLD